MASSDTEMKAEVRGFVGYSTSVLSAEDMDLVLSRAKTHISAKKDVPDGFDWYSTASREEALFWYSCLFSKINIGEIGSGDIEAGAVNLEGLLAADGSGDATTWYRNAKEALWNIDTGGDYPFGVGITSPTREERVYDDSDDDEVQL